MNKKICTIGLSSLTALALAIGGASAASAAPAQAAATASQAASSPLAATGGATVSDEQKAADLTAFLEEITSVPDSVLAQGDEATVAWIEANTDVDTSGSTTRDASIPGCIGSIAVAIAGVAFPAAKILKIKKLADELGGVAKAVELLWGASFNYEKVQAAGGALASLGAELIGIASIKEQCFE